MLVCSFKIFTLPCFLNIQERIEDGKEILMQIENEVDQLAEGDEGEKEATKLNDENQIPKEVADNNQVIKSLF